MGQGSMIAGVVAFKAKQAQDLAKSINLGDNSQGGNQNAFDMLTGRPQLR